MKKTVLVVMALIAAMLLCACGGGDEDTTQPSDSVFASSQPSAGPIGYTVTYDGVQFGVDMDAAAVVEALGQAKDRAVTESCAFGGNDIVYDYQSVKISTNDENGYERIYCIELADDMAQTEEGIKIGSSADAITAAYGEATTTNAGGFIYSKDGMELRFLLKDGKVTSIQYLVEGTA